MCFVLQELSLLVPGITLNQLKHYDEAMKRAHGFEY